MRKSTFIGNLVVFVALAALCCAFLAWYHTAEDTLEVIGGSALAQLGVVLASPVLLYSLGVIVGLALVWFKRIAFGRVAKVVLRTIGVAGLAFIALCAVPVLAPDAGGSLLGPVVVVVYVTMVAPILVMMLGFAYALGCAGVDASKRGPFAKYLPDDHFE